MTSALQPYPEYKDSARPGQTRTRMSRTRTGQFGIGFRRFRSGWHSDLAQLIAWAKANDFECLDVKGAGAVKQVAAAGEKAH